MKLLGKIIIEEIVTGVIPAKWLPFEHTRRWTVCGITTNLVSKLASKNFLPRV
jgi:hypothetical protein